MRSGLLVGVENEIDNIQARDAIMVKRRIIVEREQELRMVVADGFERGEFACECGLVANGVRHLKVAWDSVLKCHEIDLSVVKDADVDFAEAAAELKIHDILEKMPEIFAFRSEKRAAEPHVGNVVLCRRLEILPSLYVVAVNPIEKKSLAERVDVGVQRCMRYGEAFAFEHSDNFVHREQIADVVEEKSNDALKSRGVAVAISRQDVFVENRVEDAREVVVLGARTVYKLRGERETTEAQKVVEHGMGIAVVEESEILREVQRLKSNFDIASCKERCQFAGKEFGIGAGNVHIKVLAGVESVNELLKFGNILNFVEKDVGLADLFYIWLDEFPCFAPTGEGGAVGILEVYRDYTVCGYSVIGKAFSEQFKECGFPAAADAGDNLDNILVVPAGKPVGEPFPLYFAVVHRIISQVGPKFVGMIAFFVAPVNVSCVLTRHFAPTTHFPLTTSRRNGRIRRFNISTTRRRLAPSIRLRNQPKGKRSKER